MTDLQIVPAARRELEEIADLLGRSDDWVSYAARSVQRSDTWIWVARQSDRLAGLVDLREAWIGQDAVGGSRLKRIGKRIVGRNVHRSDAILTPYRYGRILDLAVVEGAPYREIRTALLNQCVQQMQQSRIETLQLELNGDDKAAQELCLGLGFEMYRYLLARKIPAKTLPAQEGIRPAEMDDLPQLSEMMRQEIELQVNMGQMSGIKPDVNWEQYAAEKLKSPDMWVLVRAVKGQLSGYSVVRLFPKDRETVDRGMVAEWLLAAAGRQRRAENGVKMLAFIEDVYVKESARRKGVGERLLGQVDRRCQQDGVMEMRAEIFAKNQASLALSL